jgi:hypothetical protein
MNRQMTFVTFHAFLGTIVYCKKVINVAAIVNNDILMKFSVM